MNVAEKQTSIYKLANDIRTLVVEFEKNTEQVIYTDIKLERNLPGAEGTLIVNFRCKDVK